MLELADENFKTAIINTLKDLGKTSEGMKKKRI